MTAASGQRIRGCFKLSCWDVAFWGAVEIENQIVHGGEGNSITKMCRDSETCMAICGISKIETTRETVGKDNRDNP